VHLGLKIPAISHSGVEVTSCCLCIFFLRLPVRRYFRSNNRHSERYISLVRDIRLF
jgi:hypothetical protein